MVAKGLLRADFDIITHTVTHLSGPQSPFNAADPLDS